MKTSAILLSLSLFLLPRPVSAADTAALLQRAAAYGREVARLEISGKPASLEKLLEQGDTLAAELKPVIEQLADEDYAAVGKSMQGYVVNREEVILLNPDMAFFAALAGKIGTEPDRRYFNFMLKVMPDGYWPVYIVRQTDVGGCIDFGPGALSTLYREGLELSPKLPGYYRQQLDLTLEDLSDQLTTGTCACGDLASFKKELTTFLSINPKTPITEKVKLRLRAIHEEQHPIRENCIGGT